MGTNDPRLTMICVLSIALAGVGSAPTALAHNCTAEKGEPGEASCSEECVKGENHSHKVTHHHENGWGRDESHVHYECTSRATDDPECPIPRVAGYCLINNGLPELPPIETLREVICRLVGDANPAGFGTMSVAPRLVDGGLC